MGPKTKMLSKLYHLKVNRQTKLKDLPEEITKALKEQVPTLIYKNGFLSIHNYLMEFVGESIRHTYELPDDRTSVIIRKGIKGSQ